MVWGGGDVAAGPQEIENVKALGESDDKAMEYESDKEENGSDIEN